MHTTRHFGHCSLLHRFLTSLRHRTNVQNGKPVHRRSKEGRFVHVAFVVVRDETNEMRVVVGKLVESELADSHLLHSAAQRALVRSGMSPEESSKYIVLDLYPASQEAFIRARLKD